MGEDGPCRATTSEMVQTLCFEPGQEDFPKQPAGGRASQTSAPWGTPRTRDRVLLSPWRTPWPPPQCVPSTSVSFGCSGMPFAARSPLFPAFTPRTPLPNQGPVPARTLREGRVCSILLRKEEGGCSGLVGSGASTFPPPRWKLGLITEPLTPPQLLPPRNEGIFLFLRREY